jgi:hypothetical protein
MSDGSLEYASREETQRNYGILLGVRDMVLRKHPDADRKWLSPQLVSECLELLRETEPMRSRLFAMRGSSGRIRSAASTGLRTSRAPESEQGAFRSD